MTILNQSGASRTDTIVKVMLVLFISLLSFSVGTFVGKQVSDSDHRRMALEGGSEREVASDEGRVSEKDVESLADEFVKSDEEEKGKQEGEKSEAKNEDGYKTFGKGEDHASAEKELKKEEKWESKEKPEHGSTEKHEMSKVAKMQEDGTHKAAEKVAENEAPTDGKSEARKPAATLPGVAGSTIGKFTVQVASYATEDEAKGHASQLKNKGWNAFYIPAAINGKTWYRVSVGLFNNANAAKAFRTDFVKESNTKTAIVQKIVE